MSQDILRLQTGDPLQLQFLDDDGRDRCYVKLIGYLPMQSLLVTSPRSNGKLMLIREGQGFVVRLLSRNSVYAFNTSVIRSCTRPYPYLHLTYPKELAHTVVRKAQRAPTEIIVSVQNEQPDKGFETPRPGVFRDISTTGALLAAETYLGEVGDLITVSAKLQVAGSEEYLSLPAVIRNRRHDAQADAAGEDAYCHGVEFQLLEARDSLALHGFVNEQLVRSLAGE